MFIIAAICGLNGAGCALASPNWFSAAPLSGRASKASDATAIRSNTNFRMESYSALQRALGLDGNFRVGIGRGAADDADLFVAILVAGDVDVLRIDVLGKSRNLVGPERIRPRHDADLVLQRHRDLGIRNSRATAVADEAEIGRTAFVGIVVIVAETRAAGPCRDRHDAGCGHDEDVRRETNRHLHSILRCGSRGPARHSTAENTERDSSTGPQAPRPARPRSSRARRVRSTRSASES